MVVIPTPARMISDALDLVCSEYDAREPIEPRVLAGFSDAPDQKIALSATARRLPDLGVAISEAEKAARSAKAERYTSIIPLLEQDVKLIFVAAVIHEQRILSAVKIEEKTGSFTSDLVLISQVVSGEREYELHVPQDWIGPTIEMKLDLTAEIIRFPIQSI